MSIRQEADIAMLRILVGALLQQTPDKTRLRHDVSEMAEDHEVRTIYSAMPEEFFEEFRLLWSGWKPFLAELAES